MSDTTPMSRPLPSTPSAWRLLGRIKESSLFLPVCAILFLLVLATLISPGFVRPSNLWSLLSVASILALAGFGQTIVIVSGGQGIDMSVGATMTLAALLVSGIGASVDANLVPAVLAVLAAGLVIGTVNFLGVFFVGIYPLIMTLGMGFVVSGVVLLYAQARGNSLPSPLMLEIGSGRLGPVPITVIVVAAIGLLLTLVLRLTKLGRRLFLVGSNRQAARLSGAPVALISWLAYVASSMLAGLAGILLFGYAGAANLSIGDPYTLLSVAAAVVGGTALSGGRGTILGAALGAIVFVILTNLLVTMGLSPALRDVCTGVLLIAILAFTARESGP